MSSANLNLITLSDTQEKVLPCGLRTLFIAGKTPESTYDLVYGDGTGCLGLAVSFNYDYAQPLKGGIKVIAHGEVFLIFTT